MEKNVGFRATEQQQKKLEYLSVKTGLSVSDVLRSLVEIATIETHRVFRPALRGIKNDGSSSVS